MLCIELYIMMKTLKLEVLCIWPVYVLELVLEMLEFIYRKCCK